MVTQETLRLARTAAEELRQRGEFDRAKAIDALVEASRDEALPALDVVTSSAAGDVLGVTGQTIKNWVRQRRLAGYRGWSHHGTKGGAGGLCLPCPDGARPRRRL
jgi:hypothetical protein